MKEIRLIKGSLLAIDPSKTKRCLDGLLISNRWHASILLGDRDPQAVGAFAFSVEPTLELFSV